jgi:hypothetical protein
MTLDDSQTVLLSLCVSYDGDGESRCHEMRRGENQVTEVDARRGCSTRRPSRRETHSLPVEFRKTPAHPERVSSSSACMPVSGNCCHDRGDQTCANKKDFFPPGLWQVGVLFSPQTTICVPGKNGIGRDNVPLFAHCCCRRWPGCLSSFSGRHC